MNHLSTCVAATLVGVFCIPAKSEPVEPTVLTGLQGFDLTSPVDPEYEIPISFLDLERLPDKFVGVTTNGKVFYSSSGSSWIEAPNPNAPPSWGWAGQICNGLFGMAMVGAEYTHHSEDGIIWQRAVQDFTNFGCTDVIFAEGTYVACGAQPSSLGYDFLRSSDGETWTPLGATHYGRNINGIAHDGFRFVAVGYISGGTSPSGVMYASEDGSTWSTWSAGGLFSDIEWDGTRFLVSTNNGGVFTMDPDDLNLGESVVGEIPPGIKGLARCGNEIWVLHENGNIWKTAGSQVARWETGIGAPIESLATFDDLTLVSTAGGLLIGYYGTGPNGTPPSATPDTAVTVESEPLKVTPVENDTDDGAPKLMYLQSVSAGLHGSTTFEGRRFTYTPTTGFVGPDLVNYTVSDGAASASSAVTIEVLPTSELRLPFDSDSPGAVHEVHGLPMGSSTNTTPASGHSGQALSFNGADASVAIDPIRWQPSIGSDARTVSAWVRTGPSGNIEPVVSWGPDLPGQQWNISIDDSGHLIAGTSSGWIAGSTNLRDNAWHHVAVVFADDGTPDIVDSRLFVDGTEEVYSSSLAAPLETAGVPAVTIGSDAQGRHFGGLIDEVRIYHRAVSETEIANLASATWQAAEAWHLLHFPGEPIDWAADDDHDGLSRLHEYALASDPHSASAGDLPELTIADGAIRLDFSRPVEPNDLVYSIEESDNLEQWETIPFVIVHESADVPSGHEQVVIDGGTVGSDHAFVRLRFELNPPIPE